MSQPATTFQRRWLQFSLRTLLIVTAVAAGLAFAYVKLVEPYRLQREAMAAITKLGGSYKTQDATGWVRYLDKQAQDVVVVDLADCDKPDEYLPYLARLPKLRTLVIGGHSVGDEQVAALGRTASLKGLVLDSTLVSNERADELKEALPDLVVYKTQRRACDELKRLGATLLDDSVLADSRSFLRAPVPPALLRDDANIAYFRNPTVIVNLDGRHVGDADLHWLADLTELRAMQLNKTEIAGGCLASAALSSLEYLTLAGTRVDDRTIHSIARCNNLRTLDLSGTQITDEAASTLMTLTTLEELRLTNTSITDKGFRSIAKLRQLKTLAAPKSMGDQGLAALAELPVLEDLDLRGSMVSDEGLEMLRRTKGLNELWCGSRITDRGVSHLEACKGLTYLSISETAISPSGFKRLKKALPNCDIDTGGRFAR